MSESVVTRRNESIEFSSTPTPAGGMARVHTVDMNSAPEHLKQSMKRRASIMQGVGTPTADGVSNTFFSPFRIRPSLEAPTKRVDLNEWYRYYVKHDPVVGTAIDLHARFPLSKFAMDHEDSALSQLFNDEVEFLELNELLPQMGMEFFSVGECFPFGFLDDPADPTRFERFILLDPDNIRMNRHPLARGKHDKDYVIRLQADGDLKKIVNNGPNDPHTGELYRNLPVDIIEHVKANRSIPLHPLQVSHFKRQVNPFNVRGESILSRILQDLMLLDKYRDAQYSAADRYTTPTEFYLIGEPGDPADEAELQDFRDVLAGSYHSYNRTYVWHHAVNIHWEGVQGKLLPMASEYDFIKQRVMAGLMLNESILTATGTYANSSVALEILISRYMEYRDKLSRWIIKSIFEPLCKMNNIYKPTEAELSHKIQIRDKLRKPWVPKVTWERPTLRDDSMKVQLVERLVNQMLLPRDDLYRALNKNPEQVRDELKHQAEQDARDRASGLQMQPGQKTPGGGLPMGLPSGGGMGGLGGGMPGLPTGLPAGAGNLPIPQVSPTGGPLSGAPAGMRPPISTQPLPNM